MTVLLLEKSNLVSERLRAMLANLKCVESVESAVAVEAAVRLMQDSLPEVAVMEADLPDADGLRVLARLKAACPAARVIVMSRESSEPFRRRWLEAGADSLFDVSTEADVLMESVCRCGCFVEAAP